MLSFGLFMFWRGYIYRVNSVWSFIFYMTWIYFISDSFCHRDQHRTLKNHLLNEVTFMQSSNVNFIHKRNESLDQSSKEVLLFLIVLITVPHSYCYTFLHCCIFPSCLLLQETRNMSILPNIFFCRMLEILQCTWRAPKNIEKWRNKSEEITKIPTA